jgi:uncharacterized coiled-coil protein SlyX
MPEHVLAVVAAGIMSLFGVSFRKIDQADRRMDALELKVAENYVTKAEFREQFVLLFKTLARLEDKIDAHVSEDAKKIDLMIKRYDLDK